MLALVCLTASRKLLSVKSEHRTGVNVVCCLGHSLIEASAWVRKNPSVQGEEAGAKVYSIQREGGCMINIIMLHRSNASAAIRHFAFTLRNGNHTAFSHVAKWEQA